MLFKDKADDIAWLTKKFPSIKRSVAKSVLKKSVLPSYIKIFFTQVFVCREPSPSKNEPSSGELALDALLLFYLD